VQMNLNALDQTLSQLFEVKIPDRVEQLHEVQMPPESQPVFARDILGRLMKGRGDEIPVSAMPVDGTFPTGTSRWEKRGSSTTDPLPLATLPATCRERITNQEGRKIMNLSTKYLGLNLRTPLVPSASPLSESLDYVKRMEDAGAAAVVFHSLFEEHILNEGRRLQHHLTHGTESYSEALAQSLVGAGANGLVLFNRFYQPDLNLESLEVSPNILLSTPMAMRLPLRWIAILRGRIQADLAATSGIHRATDVIKMVMAGADVTMLCSVLMRHGIDHLRVIEREIVEWLEKHEYDSLEQLKGSMSQARCHDPEAFERAQYVRGISTSWRTMTDM
jgi:Domain of unknown function